MVIISDFKVFIVFVALGLPFPQVHLSVGEVGGGGGGRGAQQASSLSSKHKLWNFHSPVNYSIAKWRRRGATGFLLILAKQAVEFPQVLQGSQPRN